MTALAGPATRFGRLADGRLVAECFPCHVHARQVLGYGDDDALDRFLAHHPGDPSATHVPGPVRGWCPAAYGYGALSQ